MKKENSRCVRAQPEIGGVAEGVQARGAGDEVQADREEGEDEDVGEQDERVFRCCGRQGEQGR